MAYTNSIRSTYLPNFVKGILTRFEATIPPLPAPSHPAQFSAQVTRIPLALATACRHPFRVQPGRDRPQRHTVIPPAQDLRQHGILRWRCVLALRWRCGRREGFEHSDHPVKTVEQGSKGLRQGL